MNPSSELTAVDAAILEEEEAYALALVFLEVAFVAISSIEWRFIDYLARTNLLKLQNSELALVSDGNGFIVV